MALIVQKYGGTSVANLRRIRAVAQHIAACVNAGNKIVVVVSARGTETDEMLQLAKKLCPHPPERELDMLLSSGERVSMTLLAIALHGLSIPSISYTGSQVGIITDDTHGDARIQKITGERIRRSLEAEKVVIVAGFQGVSESQKEVTTLGRGGSDLTAIALSIALNADDCELYKDVDGLYSAHPQMVPTANKISSLSWTELATYAENGSQIVHSRGAFLAKKFRKPFTLRSSFDFSSTGTRVEGDWQMESAYIKAITHRSDTFYVKIYSANLDRSAQKQFFEKLMATTSELKLPLLVHSLSADEHGATVQMVASKDCLSQLQKGFSQGFQELVATGKIQMELTEDVTLFTLVGGNFSSDFSATQYIMSQYGSEMLFFEAKGSFIYFVLKSGDTEETLNDLHKKLVKSYS